MSAKTEIHLRQCGKTFPDGTRALEPLDLTIAGGETLVLLGPSGCGKTTLLRIIAGLESPDQGGQIIFNDDNVTHLPIEKRAVGMVFQSYALFPNMTVWENVAYGLKVQRRPAAEIKQRVQGVMDMMQITQLADRRINQLSGGQRQRVALARATAVQPRVLLLDEPLTALDALLRDHLRVEIDTLLRTLGITAVYVTHDQGEAMALGDRIVVMSNGRIEQIGTPRQIYFEPQTDFVADFIGTINRVPSALIAGDRETAGQGASVMFRPEDVEIVPVGQGDMEGRVVSSLFLGDRVRIVLDIASTHTITVDLPARHTVEIGQKLALVIAKKMALSCVDPVLC